MALDGEHGDLELAGDLAVPQAPGNQLEHVPLSIGEERFPCPLRSVCTLHGRHEQACELRLERRLADQDAAQRTEQLRRADRLRDETERARRDRGEDVLGRRPNRPDERGNGLCLLREALERVRAAERRQLEIDDGDAGGLGRNLCEELVEIPCFADGECPVPLGHDAQAGAEDRRGVGHDDKRSSHATGPPAPAKLRPGLAAWPLSEAVWP